MITLPTLLPTEFMPLGFNYDNYPTIEKRMVKVLLERAGYTDIVFQGTHTARTRQVIAKKGDEWVRYILQ